MSAELEKLATVGKYLCVLEAGQSRECKFPKETEMVEVGQEIRFKLNVLDTLDVKGFQSVHYDMLVLCAAIEFADRRWKRPLSWARTFHLTIPVTDFATWQKPEVQDRLRNVLRHVTCDTWHFTFVPAKNCSPIGERQRELPLAKKKSFVVAYSDGLDSLATSALASKSDEVLCIRVAKHHQCQKSGDKFFTQIPFTVRGYRHNESSFRSRGFQFAAVTAIAAHLSNIHQIVVPESGQGALGTVLLPLHLIHADCRNHPTFFRKMELFVKAVLGYQVQYAQPRLWFTKGQTLRAFLDLPGRGEADLTDRRSCWQEQFVVNTDGGKKQCGLCAACLLRRMSMYAAGIHEGDDTYVVSNLTATDVQEALAIVRPNALRDTMIEYGLTGVRHLQQLADLADVPDDRLRADVSEIASATGASQEDTLKNLRTLLVTHAQEWRAFLSIQGEQSFLNNWLEGGRFG